MKTKSRIVSIKKEENISIGSKIAEILACVCTAIPTIMIFMALFIDYTEAEKNFMLVLIILSLFFIFISDPKEFIEIIKMTIRADYNVFYDDDEYEEYWMEEAQAYYDPYKDLFFFYDEYNEEYYYFNNQKKFDKFRVKK